jgi:tape measure domain-containing protein
MANDLDALLKVQARVTGQQDLREADALLKRLGVSADNSAGGMRRMASAGNALQGALAALGLGAVVAGLTAYGRLALTAGEDSQLLALRVKALAEPLGEVARLQTFTARAAEQFTLGQNDAGQAVTDLYGRLRPMGVSLGQIETTFIGVSKAARLSGLGAFDAKEAFRQLGQAMGSGRLQGDELRSLMERMPAIGQAIVEVFNDISRSRGLQQITRQRAEQLVAEVRDGEKKQTEELQEGIRVRQRAMQRDTDDQLRLIARRYDALRTAMNQAEEDGDTSRDRATQDRLDVEKKAIDERYEMERDAIEERGKLLLKEVSGDTSLSDAQREAVEKRIADERDAILDGIQERQSEELKRLSRGYEDQANQSRRAREADRKEREMALQDQQRAEEDQLRESLRRRQEDLQSAMNKELEIQKEANKKAIVDILLRSKVTVGDIKKMGAEGLITTDIMLKAMDKLAQKSIPPPTALMEFNKAMKDLTKVIGDDLLPTLTPAIQGITSLIKSFIAAPGWAKQLTVGLGLLVAALGSLALLVASAKFIGVSLGIVKLIKHFKDLSSASRLARDATKTIGEALVPTATISKPVTPQQLGLDLSKKFQGYQLPLELDLVTPKIPPIKADLVPDVPPSAMSRLMSSLGGIGRALRGLIADVALFGVKLLGLIPGVGRLGAAFASLRIGATIAGWLGALGPFAGQAIAAMAPFLAWITGTLLPTLVGVFSGPVGWIALGLAALVVGMIYFREPIMDFLSWALEEIAAFWGNVWNFIYETQLEPWVNLWNTDLLKPIRDAAKSWLNSIVKFFGGILEFIDKNWLKQWGAYWESFANDPFAFIEKVQKRFGDLLSSVVETWKRIPGILQNVWDSVLNGMGRTWSWMINGAVGKLNEIIGLWNRVAQGVNKLPTQFKLPVIPEFVREQIPRFARGGWVSRPTIAQLGEGGDPGGEYAIPAGRMNAAMAAWMQGVRGPALVQAWQSSPSPAGAPAAAPLPGSYGAAPQVTLQLEQTGPTLQMSDGSQWIRRDEAMALLQSQTRATLAAVDQMNRSAVNRNRYGPR